MRKIKPNCRGCGAEIRHDDEKCPYCGHPHVQHRPDRIGDPQEKDDHFAIDREEGTIRFGDGATGRRPASGRDNISAAYRAGAGASRIPGSARTGSGMRVINCSACGTENPVSHKICINCNAKL
ncbi:MAG: hypothetical protein ACXABY_04175 [Candidatus Thorarchaeota archaeon]